MAPHDFVTYSDVAEFFGVATLVTFLIVLGFWIWWALDE